MEIKVKNDNDHGGIIEKTQYSKVYIVEYGNYYEVYYELFFLTAYCTVKAGSKKLKRNTNYYELATNYS